MTNQEAERRTQKQEESSKPTRSDTVLTRQEKNILQLRTKRMSLWRTFQTQIVIKIRCVNPQVLRNWPQSQCLPYLVLALSPWARILEVHPEAKCGSGHQ